MLNKEAHRPLKLGILGFSILGLYFYTAYQLIPLPERLIDTRVYEHYVATNFTYASSPFDLSVISPFQGAGGLVQPIGVWLHPTYILRQLLPPTDDRVCTYAIVSFLLAAATFHLGKANGLPTHVAVLGAQLVSIALLPPLSILLRRVAHLTGAHMYELEGATAVLLAFSTTLLGLFTYLGRQTFGMNAVCMLLFPCVLVYSVLCDPLFTSLFCFPIICLIVGVTVSSRSRGVLAWRILGGLLCVIVCLILRLPVYYRGLFGYAARFFFPNELYVEVQQWDELTGNIFQGGLATTAMVVVLVSCVIAGRDPNSDVRGLAHSLLVYQLILIVVNLLYVYSGIRWSYPLPIYLEVGAQPAFLIVTILAVRRVLGGLAFCSRGTTSNRWRFFWAFKDGLTSQYSCVMILPLIASVSLLTIAKPGAVALAQDSAVRRQPVGIVKFLEEQLAIGETHRFRGSVAMLLAVPGGGLMNSIGYHEKRPFTKGHINLLGEYFRRTFDPSFSVVGFWNLHIPTVQDYCHLITPPFHFLATRTLSRPQDYHSRNWVMITKANVKVLAALGARYLLSDKVEIDPGLTLRTKETNVYGITVYAYEIQGANVGNMSPIHTCLCNDATETTRLMTSPEFSFRDTAIVNDAPLAALRRAKSGGICFEKGGVRVKASSDGLSLLVIPIHFSNSLEIASTERNSTGLPIRLLRVNLVQTGVLFDGEIDITIRHNFGVFRRLQGRLDDIDDCHRLSIKEDGSVHYPPGYQPRAIDW